MNNIKKYIKNIWTIMPMHTKKEKFYVSELKKHLNEYLDDHPQCSYDDIVQQFGEPKDIVVEYIQSSDENDLIKRMKLKMLKIPSYMKLKQPFLIIKKWRKLWKK